MEIPEEVQKYIEDRVARTAPNDDGAIIDSVVEMLDREGYDRSAKSVPFLRERLLKEIRIVRLLQAARNLRE
jgi:hypothetical protein